MLETLALMGQGFIKALTLINLLAMVGGVTLGIIIGCLPASRRRWALRSCCR